MTAGATRNLFFCLAILALLCAAATPLVHEWIHPSAALTGEKGHPGFWGDLARWSARIDAFFRQLVIMAGLCVAAAVASLIAFAAAWRAKDTRGRKILVLSPFLLVALAMLYFVAMTF